MKANNHEIINIQLALIFSDKLSEPADIFVELRDHDIIKEINSKPKLVPLPEDPKLDQIAIVSAEDKYRRLLIARKRADFHFGGNKKNFQEIKGEFHKYSELFFDFVHKSIAKQGLSISGMGFVTKFFFRDKNAGESISNLIKVNPVAFLGGSSIDNAELRMVTNDFVGDMELRNFLNINTINVTYESEKPIKGVEITRDFNNVNEKGLNLTWENVYQVLVEGESKFKITEISSLLWPHDS